MVEEPKPKKATDPEDPKVKALRKLYEGAFWVYTVIITFAIREVLIHILPRFFNYYWQAGLNNEPTPARPVFYLELVRSIVFLIMIARFYLGGVRVFSELTKETAVPPDRSWLHVLTGFVHFLLFFGWALTAFAQAHPWHVSLFLWVLIGILLWGVVLWLCLRSQEPRFKSWMFRNLRTLIYMLALFVGFYCLDPLYAEVAALIAVALVSLKELHEMLTKKDPPDKFFAFP